MQLSALTHQGNFITVEGNSSIYYSISGNGAPLLLIPGSGGDSWWFHKIVDILATQYKVITYDLRSHARSISPGSENFEISQQSRDAAAVINAAGEKSAHIVGCSSGGIIGLAIATHHPQTVKSLTVFEPPLVRLHPHKNRLHRLIAKVYHDAFKWGPAIASLRFALGARLPLGALLKGAKDQKLYFTQTTEKRSKPQLADEFLAFAALTNYLPNMDVLRSNGVSIFMAAGSDSWRKKRFYAQVAAILAEKFNQEMVIFPGHHLSFYHTPNEWSSALMQHLQRVAYLNK